jgi:TRAP-type C4-dicarboxylate transport system substrate-binding protein
VLKAAAAAESRGWAMSEQKDREYQQELAAKGMKISAPSDAVTKELRKIGETMTQEWIKTAGADGKQIIDAYTRQP